MGMQQRTITATIKLPEEMALKIEAMTKEREMRMDVLLSHLIQVGFIDLTKNPPRIEPGRLSGDATASMPKF